jgi:flagellin-like hook-associated protein FlgL
MANLIQAMQSNTGFTTAMVSLRDAFDYTSGQRVFYGNTMNQAQAQSTYLDTAKLQLSQQENTLASADIADAASRFVNSHTATNATLAAIGRLSQHNLFEFLKYARRRRATGDADLRDGLSFLRSSLFPAYRIPCIEFLFLLR